MKLSISLFHLPFIAFLTVRKEQAAELLKAFTGTAAGHCCCAALTRVKCTIFWQANRACSPAQLPPSYVPVFF